MTKKLYKLKKSKALTKARKGLFDPNLENKEKQINHSSLYNNRLK